MASKSAQQEPEKAEVIEEALDALDTALDRVKVLYEQYFLGIQKQPPQFLHTDVERKLRDLALLQIRNTALRYRFVTLQQKFGSYNTYWRRTLREIEAGRYHRSLSKVGRKAAATGAEIPQEILVAMPKRMREQVRRDREAQLALQRRREGDAVGDTVRDMVVDDAVDDELLTLAPLEGDDGEPGFVSEPPEVRQQALRARGGLHVLDEADADLDLDAYFREIEQELAPVELPAKVAPPAQAPARVRPSAAPALELSDEDVDDDAATGISMRVWPEEEAPTQARDRRAAAAAAAVPPVPPRARTSTTAVTTPIPVVPAGAVTPTPTLSVTVRAASISGPVRAKSPTLGAVSAVPPVPPTPAQPTPETRTQPARPSGPLDTQPDVGAAGGLAARRPPTGQPLPEPPATGRPPTGQPVPPAPILSAPIPPTSIPSAPISSVPIPPTSITPTPETVVTLKPAPRSERTSTSRMTPIAPSQATRPIPITPGAAAARSDAPVETLAGPFARNPAPSSSPPSPPSPRPPPIGEKARSSSAAPPEPSPPVGMTPSDVKTLYAKYVKAREATGQPPDPGAYGKLMQTIHSQAPKIMEQYRAKGVEFSVVIKDNQIVIRAKPKL